MAAELVGEPQAQPGRAGIGEGQETGERVGRSVTAVGDGGHDAVRRAPQADPDRGATVDERVGTSRSATPLRAGLWPTSLCSTAHPSATTSRGRMPGPPRVPVVAVAHDPAHPGAVGHRQTELSLRPGQLADQGVLSGGVLDCGGGDIGGHPSGVQLGGGRTPATHVKDAVAALAG